MQSNHHNHKKHRDSPPKVTDVGINELPVVEISDRMHRLAELIAEARQITYEPIEGGDTYGNQSSIDAQLTGVLGELAVQKVANCIHQPIYLRGDPGYDLSVDGETVDVKTTATNIPVPDLIIPHDQDIVADVFLLAHRIKPRQIRLVGWAPRHVVMDTDPERYPGDSLNYVVSPKQLYAPQLK